MAVQYLDKNGLINGCLEYWQRGTTFTSPASGVYCADRFVYLKNGTMVHTVSRSTDVPVGAFGQFSILIDCTTAQPTLLSTNNCAIEQRIEGINLRLLRGKNILLAFWVKATKPGIYCAYFRNGTLTRSIVREYVVNTANVWERKVVRFNHSTDGTWDYTTGLGMRMGWTLCTDGIYMGPENVWLNSNVIATGNQVNACDSVANNFQLADMVLMEDNQDQTRNPDFVLAGRDLVEELQLCQRYCEVLPAQMNLDNSAAAPNGAWQFKVTKRAIPVVTGNINGSLNNISVNHVCTNAANTTVGFVNGARADAEL